MSGETDLKRLLASMSARLAPGVHVFVTLVPGVSVPDGLDPVMVFREAEGVTLILREEAAQAAGLKAHFRCRMITLTVHSSLEAVGFLAAIAAQLAAAGISCNAVSAFYHDHLFVPVERAEEAMELLEGMAGESAGGAA